MYLIGQEGVRVAINREIGLPENSPANCDGFDKIR